MSKAYYSLLKVRKLMQKCCSKQQDKMETLSDMMVYPIRNVIFSVRSFLSVCIGQCLQYKFKLAFSYVNIYSKPMEVKIESGE